MEYNLVLKLARGDDEEVVLPDGVVEIADGVFRSRKSLKKIVIPEGCTKIGQSVFRDCAALEEVVLPESATAIGDYCFKNCTSLKRIVLPSKTKRLSQEVFAGCSSLETIEGAGQIERIEREALCDCAALRGLSEQPVKYVGNRAFSNCSKLERIDFGLTVTFIGEMAFRNCGSLREAKLPASTIGLKDNAFADCPDFPVDNEELVKRFPNAFPREVAQAHGVLRPIDRNTLAREFRENHAADREELEQRRDEISKQRARLEKELPGYGVLDLKKRDAVVEQIEDIEAETTEIDLLLAEIKSPSWETLLEEFIG